MTTDSQRRPFLSQFSIPLPRDEEQELAYRSEPQLSMDNPDGEPSIALEAATSKKPPKKTMYTEVKRETTDES